MKCTITPHHPERIILVVTTVSETLLNLISLVNIVTNETIDQSVRTILLSYSTGNAIGTLLLSYDTGIFIFIHLKYYQFNFLRANQNMVVFQSNCIDCIQGL